MSTLISDTPQKHYQESGDENEVNFMLTPDMRPEIKNEPPEDIDDRPQSQMSDGCTLQQNADRKPNIRLTPTMKLLASPNPVDPKRKFSCPYDNCTKSYGKSSHLRSHLTWHTGVKPYVCQEPNCGKSFTRSDELNRHSRTHTGEKPFECMQCGKKFSRSDHLTKHVATHTKQIKKERPAENFVSQIADEQTPNTAEVDEPEETKKIKLTELPLPDQEIDYTDGMHFMASLLECTQFKHGRHVIEPENLTDEHLDARRLPIRIKLEKPEHSDEYKIVNGCLEENGELEEKVKIKTEVESAEDTKLLVLHMFDTSTTNQDVNGVKAEDEELYDDENTNDDTIMPEANAPPLPVADSMYMSPRQLSIERPYGCSQCIKSFKRQDDLNRHLRTHTGEKPYACNACEKRFMRSDHLKKHQKTHFK